MKLILLFYIILSLVSCTGGSVKYRVGVSQCSDDIWRDKQNAELRMGAYFHDNVELKFAAAYDSDKRQVQQIDSLLNEGVDLLIVAPNQVQTISPAIDRAFDSGIPVIVFERKTSSQKYTALISADNYEMGRVMGEYVISRLGGKGQILEVKGLEGSSPSIERHKGFVDAIGKSGSCTVVASLQGDWTEESAYEAVSQWLIYNKDVKIDYVYAHNDRMAMGARRAFTEVLSTQAPTNLPPRGRLQPKAPLPSGEGQGEGLPTTPHPMPLFCGIDGLPGKSGGIKLVRDSLLDASYIYPTHGDQIIDLAIDILEGRPFNKETMMMSALVTRDNAKVLQMQSEEMMQQAARLDQLHDKADGYLKALGAQRVVTWLALAVIVLLVVAMVLFYLYHLRKVDMQRERVVSTLWDMGSTGIQHQTPEAHEAPEAPPSAPEGATIDSPLNDKTIVAPSGAEGGASGASESFEGSQNLFLVRFRERVEARLNDSDLSVDDLAAELNLSRVQLYRKVKAITGSSPVELLRTARLKRAYQLLLTSDKSVSEVAYAVGFTAPSYFTKCFKEEYGMVPGDVRK